MKKQNGITIISLVVTIIILIILAGVSINLILGKNGIITIAKQAKENTELAKIEEETALNELYMQIKAEGGTTGDISYDAITKLVEFKREIASAISDMGIETSEDADASTMASNIRSISGASSTDTVKYLLKDGEIVSDDLKSITVTSGSYSSNEDSIGKNLFVNTTSAAICFKIDLTNYTKLILACRCDSGNNQFNTKVNTSPMNLEEINNTGSCLDVSSYTGEYYVCAYYNNGKIHVYDILGL